MKRYGDAYEFDGYKWRYVHSGQVVPDSSTFIDPRTGTPEMNAPELLIHQMIDAPTLAGMMKITPGSLRTMLYQDRIPQPQARAGKQGPLWTRPIIEHFLSQRPGLGWRKGKKRSVA